MRMIAPLLASFHGALWAIYCSTGTIYDSLCLFFMLLGIGYYSAARKRSRGPKFRDTALLCVIAIAAFESKEIGFTLPFVLLASELVYYDSRPFKGMWRWPVVALLPAAGCCLAGAAGLRFSDSGIFYAMPGYTPSFTLQRYMASSAQYLYLLSFKTVSFSGTGAMAVLVLGTFVVTLTKSREAVFGWAFFIVTMLPISFALPRTDGYVLYVPYVGLAIAIAAVVDFAVSSIPLRAARGFAIATVCGLIVWAQVTQAGVALERGFGPGGMIWIEQLTEYAKTMCLTWGPGARIAVIDNPFGNDWPPDFVLNLACTRKDLEIETAQLDSGRGSGFNLKHPAASYASVVQYSSDRYRNLSVGEIKKLSGAAEAR
jgi:hypothetical protein